MATILKATPTQTHSQQGHTNPEAEGSEKHLICHRCFRHTLWSEHHLAASTGYQVVLAPAGVPETSVAYEMFLARLCLWVGVDMVCIRLSAVWPWGGGQVAATLVRL